jgi:hypothetical protein
MGLRGSSSSRGTKLSLKGSPQKLIKCVFEVEPCFHIWLFRQTLMFFFQHVFGSSSSESSSDASFLALRCQFRSAGCRRLALRIAAEATSTFCSLRRRKHCVHIDRNRSSIRQRRLGFAAVSCVGHKKMSDLVSSAIAQCLWHVVVGQHGLCHLRR